MDPAAEIAALRAENERLKDRLHLDATGLAAALNYIRGKIQSYNWIPDSRGPYAWDDPEYQRETGRCFKEVMTLATEALRHSGKLAHTADGCRNVQDVVLEERDQLAKRVAELEAEHVLCHATLLGVLDRQGGLKAGFAIALGWLSNHRQERPRIYGHLRDLEEEAGCQNPGCLEEDALVMLRRLAAFESLG